MNARRLKKRKREREKYSLLASICSIGRGGDSRELLRTSGLL